MREERDAPDLGQLRLRRGTPGCSRVVVAIDEVQFRNEVQRRLRLVATSGTVADLNRHHLDADDLARRLCDPEGKNRNMMKAVMAIPYGVRSLVKLASSQT